MNLVKSEFRKLFYTRSIYGLTLGAIALAMLSTWPAAYAVERTQNLLSGESLTNPQMVAGIYGKATSGYLFAIILGIIFMGNEYQNGMAISTFLATPKRTKVLYAKLGVAALAGVAMMVISELFGFLGAYIGLNKYTHAALTSGALLSLIVAGIISGAVLAVMGVALGALIRNVRIATTGVVIWLGVIERLIVVFWTTGGKYLPSGLIVGMLNVKLDVKSVGRGLNIDTANYFGATTATLLLLAYAAVFAFLGIFTSLRRDVN